MEEITVAATIPPAGNKYIFSDFTYSLAYLYVFESSMNSYQTLEPWKNFIPFKILGESGIEEISTEETDELFDVYNLNGQNVKNQARQSEVKSPPQGIYVV